MDTDIEWPATYIPEFHYKNRVRLMTYKDLGATGLKVSHIALGTSQFGKLIDTDREQEVIETVVQAVKSGINYIDTAPYYDEGKAETMLGKALKHVPRKSYYLATKVGRYTYSYSTMFDFSSRRVYKGLEETLVRLGVEYIDVIQIHDIEFCPNFDIFLKETLPTLQKFKECGIVRHIGITGYPIEKLRQLIQISPIKIETVLSNCRLTLFENILQCYIPFFIKEKIGVINASVLGLGLLTPAGPPNWHPVHRIPPLKKACRLANEYCISKNVNIGRLAMSFPMVQPGIDCTVIGMSSMKCLLHNLYVAFNGLTPEECSVLGEIQRRFFNDLKPEHRHWENMEVQIYWGKIKEGRT